MSKRLSVVPLLLAAAVGLACGVFAAPTPSPTPMPPPTATPIPTPTVTPTSTGLPVPTAAPQAGLGSESLGDGWVRYTNTAEGYSLELPETWLVLDLTIEDIEGQIAQVAELNPELAQMIEFALAAQMVQLTFYGIDTDPAGLVDNPSGTTVNILRQDILAGSDPDLLLGLVGQQLAAMEGYTILESDVVEIGKLEGARLLSEVRMTDVVGRDIHTQMIQVLIPTEETAYVITIGTGAAHFADYEATFEQVIDSFSLLE